MTSLIVSVVVCVFVGCEYFYSLFNNTAMGDIVIATPGFDLVISRSTKVIHLADCQIDQFPWQLIGINLTKVDLSNNLLTTLVTPLGDLSRLSVRHLILTGNRLTSPPKTSMARKAISQKNYQRSPAGGNTNHKNITT